LKAFLDGGLALSPDKDKEAQDCVWCINTVFLGTGGIRKSGKLKISWFNVSVESSLTQKVGEGELGSEWDLLMSKISVKREHIIV
jgi:hypothetical protein